MRKFFLLGFAFQWSDLICYSLGVLLGVAAEYTVSEKASANTYRLPSSRHRTLP